MLWVAYRKSYKVKSLTMGMEQTTTPKVLSKLYTNVSFTRGLGDSGKKVELIEKDCDTCSYDRQLRKTDVNPVHGESSETLCMSPTCPNYHDNEWSYLLSW